MIANRVSKQLIKLLNIWSLLRPVLWDVPIILNRLFSDYKVIGKIIGSVYISLLVQENASGPSYSMTIVIDSNPCWNFILWI